MEVKKFNQYNESLRDEMKPKSEDDVKNAINDTINDYESKFDSNYEFTPDDVEKMTTMIYSFIENNDYKEEIKRNVINLLFDANYMDIDDVVEYMLEQYSNDYDCDIEGVCESLVDVIKKLNK